MRDKDDRMGRLDRELMRCASDIHWAEWRMDRERETYPSTYRRRKAYRGAMLSYERASAALRSASRVVSALAGVEAWRVMEAAMECERVERDECLDLVP